MGREFGVILAHGWSLLEAARIQGAWFRGIETGPTGSEEGLWETLRASAVTGPPPAGGAQVSNEERGLVKGHLEAAWSYVVEALHLFEQVDCSAGQRASERLMAELRDHWQPPWAASPAALRREQADSDGFVAQAPASVRVRRLLDLAADSDDPVLLTGPTGTGKELAVQRIHARGKRATGPLVAVNCGAIPELVFEREFFGHAKGAFTGADSAVPGFCERAAGGTLFLDEVGELPAGLQVKLLRLLQEGTFQRLGDPAERRVDLRIIAATNSDLLDAMARGDFRSDLYYRLQFLEVRMSPLRARREDIIPLANLFVRRATGKDLSLVDLCESGVIDTLVKHDWPGNVRELEGLVRRLCLLIRRGGRVSMAMLPSEMTPGRRCANEVAVVTVKTEGSSVPAAGARSGTASGAVADSGDSDCVALADALTRSELGLDLATRLREAEVLAIRRALTAAAGRKTEAAQMLGISRNTLYKKLRRLGLRGD
jgi:DNA-binding NtrC family response regulator